MPVMLAVVIKKRDNPMRLARLSLGPIRTAHDSAGGHRSPRKKLQTIDRFAHLNWGNQLHTPLIETDESSRGILAGELHNHKTETPLSNESPCRSSAAQTADSKGSILTPSAISYTDAQAFT